MGGMSGSEIAQVLRRALEEKVQAAQEGHDAGLVTTQDLLRQIDVRRRRAEEALGYIKAGRDFKEVAAAYSDAQDAIQGGDMMLSSQRVFFSGFLQQKPMRPIASASPSRTSLASVPSSAKAA